MDLMERTHLSPARRTGFAAEELGHLSLPGAVLAVEQGMLVARRVDGSPFAWDHLAGLPADGLRDEIVDGILFVCSSPLLRHQRAVARLVRLLAAAGEPPFEVLPAPLDWRYTDESHVEPDVLVVPSGLDPDDRIGRHTVPALLVEVLSSNERHDRRRKRDLYERLGVPSYWIVEPGRQGRAPAITALRLSDGGTYEIEADVEGAATFTTNVPFAVAVTPADLVD